MTGCASKHLLKGPDSTPLATNEGVVLATFTRKKFEVKREEYLANMSGKSLAIRRVCDKYEAAHLYPDGVNLTEKDSKVITVHSWPKQVNVILSKIK